MTKKIDLTRREELRDKWLSNITDEDYDELWMLETAQEGERQYMIATNRAVKFVEDIAKELFMKGDDNAEWMRGNAVTLRAVLLKDAPKHESYVED